MVDKEMVCVVAVCAVLFPPLNVISAPSGFFKFYLRCRFIIHHCKFATFFTTLHIFTKMALIGQKKLCKAIFLKKPPKSTKKERCIFTEFLQNICRIHSDNIQ